MAAIPDLTKYTRMYDRIQGLGKIQDAFMNPTLAFLEQEARRQRDLERVADVGKAALSVRAFGDEAYVRSQIEAASEATRMAALPSFAENLADSLTVAEERRRAEVESRYNVIDVACVTVQE